MRYRRLFANTIAEHNPLAALFRTDSQLAEQQDSGCAARQPGTWARNDQTRAVVEVGRNQLRATTYEIPMAKTRWGWEAIKQGERMAADERQRLGFGLFPMGDWVELFESQGVRPVPFRFPLIFPV